MKKTNNDPNPIEINAKIQALVLLVPPLISRIKPIIGPAIAPPAKPIIEWNANIAPLSLSFETETVPAVSAPESSIINA